MQSPKMNPQNNNLICNLEWVFGAAILCCLTSCEQTRLLEKDIFPYEGPRIVCYGNIGNDRPIGVSLFLTLHPLDTATATPLQEAEVKLYVDGAFHEELVFQEGTYVSPSGLIPQPGRTYHFTVQAPDLPGIGTLPVQLPDPPVIEGYSLHYESDSVKMSIELTIADPPEEGHYYSFSRNMYRAGLYIDAGGNLPEDRLPVFGGLLSDRLFNGASFQQVLYFNRVILIYENSIPVTSIAADEIRVKVYSVSEHYERYFDSLPESGDFGGFLPPERAVYSNVQGGYGVVGAYAVSELSVGL
jgi:hypothetical protein